MGGWRLTGSLVAACVWLGAVSEPSRATTVYRCGADGRTYSQTPCPAGDTRTLDVADERDAGQRAEARDAARRTAAAAAMLAAARERGEATRVRGPAVIPVTRKAEPAERKAGKTPKKKGRGGETGTAGPFKGAPLDGGPRQKPSPSH